MGKTLDVARDRENDQERTVLPVEVARGIYLRNPPSAQALKLVHLLIAIAGARMSEEAPHELRLSSIRKVLRHHDRASLTPLFEELSSTVLVHDDVEKQRVYIGGLLDGAEVDYREESSGDLVVTWWFGRMFRKVAEESNLWALIDRQTIFSFTSRYSILLFQHISSLVRLSHVDSRTFSVADLRAMFGVTEGKYPRFADFKLWVLNAAIEEINDLSRINLTATPIKTGRTVTSVKISWELKEAQLPPPLRQAELGLVEEERGFPRGAVYGTEWLELTKRNTYGMGPPWDWIGPEFRSFCSSKDIPLDDPGIQGVFLEWLEVRGKAPPRTQES